MIIKMIWGELAKLNTAKIVKVVSYDDDVNTVSVQPVVQKIRSTDPDNDEITLTQFDDVPVHQFGTGKTLMTRGPAVGSYGWLCFTDRAIDQWIVSGGISPPTSTRIMDLNDAFYLDGLFPLVEDGNNGKISGGIKTDRISLRTRSGKTEISVLDDETVTVKNDSGSIVIDISGNVKINGGSAEVARKGEETIADITTAPLWFTAGTGWFYAVGTALGIAPPEAFIKGKVNDGSATVKVP